MYTSCAEIPIWPCQGSRNGHPARPLHPTGTPRHGLLARQASRHPSIIAAGDIPTELLGQILCDLIPALSHCPVPSPQVPQL
jgi:hypothetical protein